MYSNVAPRPWVAYVVPFPFPWGQAGSRRVDGMSRSIAATGHDVLVVGRPSPHPVEGGDPRLLVTSPISGATVSTIARSAAPAGPLRRQWSHHMSGIRDALNLIERLGSSLPSHVIVYGTLATPLFQVLRWGRKHGVKVVADVVERYSPLQFNGGRFSPGYASATLGFVALTPRVDGVIAISRYLESYFSTRGVPTVRVPPTTDLSQVPVGEPEVEGFTLGYFGSPGRKDLLDVAVESFVRVRRGSGRKDMRLVVAGHGTREALGSRRGDDLEGVELLGEIPQQDVTAVLGSLHATMLARPPSRYAQAGYPTKVVESLGVGTPVICNLTSDLADVVREGETGWIVSEPTVEEMSMALDRAVMTSPETLREMRQQARSIAERHFDVGQHVDPLRTFIDGIA